MPDDLDHYQVLHRLGSGGMGSVYEAFDRQLQRHVAIKVLRPELQREPELHDRFLRESRCAAQINHPHIIGIYGTIERAGSIYLIMQLARGGSLAERLQTGPLPPTEAVALLRDCCRGLQALHRAGLVHRDLKPGNILLDEDGRGIIGDLGLARPVLDEDQRLTTTGQSVGTPSFMAPEQARAAIELDIRTDIYSLGATFYAMLTGDPPFTGSSMEVAHQVLAAPPPHLPRPLREVLPGADELIQRCLAKDPSKRYADPTALLRSVEGLSARPTSRRLPERAWPWIATALATVPLSVWLLTGTNELTTTETASDRPVAAVTGTTQEASAAPTSEATRSVTTTTIPTKAATTVVADPFTEPDWAEASGSDQYGRWADLIIDEARQRFRYIAAGSFQMGSRDDEAHRRTDESRHPVTISRPYWIADSECPQKFYQAVTGTNPSRFRDPQRPVEKLNWYDCIDFLRQLNLRRPELAARLPTEAEWEYACRAGSDTAYSFGDDADAVHRFGNLAPPQWGLDAKGPVQPETTIPWASHDEADGYRDETAPVKSFQPNAWGLYDCHGNVIEWVLDGYQAYADLPLVDPLGDGDQRCRRGGSWIFVAREARSAARSCRSPKKKYHGVQGFRFVIPAGGSDANKP